jgi:glycosyltransferase involved in cell wall biosynthesis
MASSPNVSFVFSGGGARRAELERTCGAEQISNASFSGYASSAGFLENLAACHIGLVTLRPECVGTVVPSKVYSFLAAGRPFLYIGPQDATPALIAREGCGWSFENGDSEGIAELLQKLAADPGQIQEAATEARRCFERRFSRPVGTTRIFRLLTSSPESPAEAGMGLPRRI